MSGCGDVERTYEPLRNERISDLNLIGKCKALTGFGGSDREIAIERRP